MFVNRQDELNILEKEYRREGSSLVVVYGRRRVGKTTLVKHFIQDKPALYFLAAEEMEAQNRLRFQQLLARYTGQAFLERTSFERWDDLLAIFARHNPQKKPVLVIDEFPYLVKANPAMPSILQIFWDELGKDSRIMLVLTGSLLGMMYDRVLSHSSPLYGRRTAQIRLKPFDFAALREYFGELSPEELLGLYAVAGGVPRYVELFGAARLPLPEAIRENILTPGSYLYEEPVFLLDREISETATYFSLLKTIAEGNHRPVHLAARLGMPVTSLTRYLQVLMDLELVFREVPVTEAAPEKSKKGLYLIKDRFFHFWFRYVFPNRDLLEIGLVEPVLEKIVRTLPERLIPTAYEEVCREELLRLSAAGKLPFLLHKAGRWWDKNTEIDILGLNHNENAILFGECKYGKHLVDVDVFFSLKEKAGRVKWGGPDRREAFCLFSGAGFTARLQELAAERKDLFLFSGVFFSEA